MGSHTAFCSSQPNNTRTSLISWIRNEICALERVQCAHAQCARKNYGTLRRRNPAGKSGTSDTTAMLRSHNPHIHIPSLSDRKGIFRDGNINIKSFYMSPGKPFKGQRLRPGGHNLFCSGRLQLSLLLIVLMDKNISFPLLNIQFASLYIPHLRCTDYSYFHT